MMMTSLPTNIACSGCQEPLDSSQQIINAKGETFHPKCFVCAQCFQPFKDGLYYEFENRKYCEFDFQILYAPLCRGCKSFINGRVLKAMSYSWHPECFRCHACSNLLIDSSFVKNANRPYCKECMAKEKLRNSAGGGNIVCQKCSMAISGEFLRYKNDTYHPYHFHCKICAVELTSTAREIKGELVCLKCQDKMDIAVCAGCHTPIDQERIVYALGKQWHVEHFACAKCEQPFNGSKHYEKKGLAYCETHFNQLFGNVCFGCNQIINGDLFTFMNKSWCVEHFCCYLCDELMTQKTKFYDLDSKPVCKKCFERLPSKTRASLLKLLDAKDKQQQDSTSSTLTGSSSSSSATSFISSSSILKESKTLFGKKK